MKINKILAAVLAAACAAGMGITAFAEDSFPFEDDTLEDAAEAVYDEPRKGEGYYVCRIVFHDGVPEIRDENGDIYGLWEETAGYIREGETRESVKNSEENDMREQLAAAGANPDDYGFDVYLYFYDDYDLTPEEFWDFVQEDIGKRGSERDNPITGVSNPVTGTALPLGAAALAVLSGVGILASGRRKLS